MINRDKNDNESDIEISPFVKSMSTGVNIPTDLDYKSEILNHLIEKGLNSDFSDFEDSLQYFSALRTECDIIITRNGKDFKKSQIPVMTPDEFLNSIKG